MPQAAHFFDSALGADLSYCFDFELFHLQDGRIHGHAFRLALHGDTTLGQSETGRDKQVGFPKHIEAALYRTEGIGQVLYSTRNQFYLFFKVAYLQLLGQFFDQGTEEPQAAGMAYFQRYLVLIAQTKHFGQLALASDGNRIPEQQGTFCGKSNDQKQ